MIGLELHITSIGSDRGASSATTTSFLLFCSPLLFNFDSNKMQDTNFIEYVMRVT